MVVQMHVCVVALVGDSGEDIFDDANCGNDLRLEVARCESSDARFKADCSECLDEQILQLIPAGDIGNQDNGSTVNCYRTHMMILA